MFVIFSELHDFMEFGKNGTLNSMVQFTNQKTTKSLKKNSANNGKCQFIVNLKSFFLNWWIISIYQSTKGWEIEML